MPKLFRVVVLLALATSALMAQSAPASRLAVMHREANRTLTTLANSNQVTGSINLPYTLKCAQACPDPGAATSYIAVVDGQPSMARVSADGTSSSITSMSTFTAIHGATPVTRKVPTGGTICQSYDLQEHAAIVGSLPDGSSGLMLLDPATLVPMTVGTGTHFTTWIADEVRDVCFCVYPGLDGNYATATDNEYRYVMARRRAGQGIAEVAVLALNATETANGFTRGPPYPNAAAGMGLNSKFGDGTTVWITQDSELYCESYFLPPGIPGCTAPPNRAYVAVATVEGAPGGASTVGLRVYYLGTESVTLLIQTGGAWVYTAASSEILKGLSIVGHWVFVTVGAGSGPGDPLGSSVRMFYLPEMCDGPADGDTGDRGSWSAPGGGTGFVAGPVDAQRRAQGVCFGSGATENNLYVVSNDPYQDWTPSIATGVAAVDCQTAAPQPLLGYVAAGSSPGSGGNGSNEGASSGGCSASSRSGLGILVALAALVATTRLRTTARSAP